MIHDVLLKPRDIELQLKRVSKEKEDLKAGQSYINFIVLRHADILLIYAEAQNKASGPDATA